MAASIDSLGPPSTPARTGLGLCLVGVLSQLALSVPATVLGRLWASSVWRLGMAGQLTGDPWMPRAAAVLTALAAGGGLLVPIGLVTFRGGLRDGVTRGLTNGAILAYGLAWLWGLASWFASIGVIDGRWWDTLPGGAPWLENLFEAVMSGAALGLLLTVIRRESKRLTGRVSLALVVMSGAAWCTWRLSEAATMDTLLGGGRSRAWVDLAFTEVLRAGFIALLALALRAHLAERREHE